jgi:hypothetical protein
MHAPRQSFFSLGQVAPQRFPSQVATPSAGASHGEHELPHVRTSSLETHASTHKC